MSRWSENNHDDNSISDEIYKLSEMILASDGKQGLSNLVDKLKNNDFLAVLNEFKDKGKYFNLPDDILSKISKLPLESQNGYKGAFMSRLEVLKAEPLLSIEDYPYSLHAKISQGQKAMLDAYDALFNAELLAFKEQRIKGLMHLGKPLSLLRTIGVNVEEMTLSPKVLNYHLKKHGLTPDDLRGLARAIQSPILAYNHGIENPNKVIVSDLFVKGGKLSISLELDNGGDVVKLNNVSSVHQKEAIQEIRRLDSIKDDLSGLLLWVDKEKVLDWFSPAGLSSLIQASNPELDSVAKILEKFENPKIIEEYFEPFDEDLTISPQKDKERDRITDVIVFGRASTGMSIKCRIDGKQQLARKLSPKDAMAYNAIMDFVGQELYKTALAYKYYGKELERTRKENNGLKQ